MKRHARAAADIDWSVWRPELDAGLAALCLAADAAMPARLLDFLALLARWNQAYNLTAISAPGEMLRLHLLDSLAIVPALEKSALAGRDEAPRLIDVGSGAGLPAIPLALMRPAWEVASVEKVEKKAAFQRQAKIQLGLRNLSVHACRAEALPAGGYDLVLSRAFASLADFVAIAGHLAAPGGSLVAMKGQLPEAEIEALPKPWHVRVVTSLAVPGVAAQRHLLLLGKD